MKVQDLFESKMLTTTVQAFAKALVSKFGIKIGAEKEPRDWHGQGARGKYTQIRLDISDVSDVKKINEFIKNAGFSDEETTDSGTRFKAPNGSSVRISDVTTFKFNGEWMIWVSGFENEFKIGEEAKAKVSKSDKSKGSIMDKITDTSKMFKQKYKVEMNPFATNFPDLSKKNMMRFEESSKTITLKDLSEENADIAKELKVFIERNKKDKHYSLPGFGHIGSTKGWDLGLSDLILEIKLLEVTFEDEIIRNAAEYYNDGTEKDVDDDEDDSDDSDEDDDKPVGRYRNQLTGRRNRKITTFGDALDANWGRGMHHIGMEVKFEVMLAGKPSKEQLNKIALFACSRFYSLNDIDDTMEKPEPI